MSEPVVPMTATHLVPVAEPDGATDAAALLEALLDLHGDLESGAVHRGLDTIAGDLAHGHLRTTAGGIVVAANRAAAGLLDHDDAGALLGSEVLGLVAPHDRDPVAQALRTRGRDVHRLAPVTFRSRSGQERDMDVGLVVAPSGAARMLFGPAADAAEGTWWPSPEVTRVLHRLPLVAYACRADDAWTCEVVTPWLVDLLGFTADRWVADPGLWLGQVHPDDRERLLDHRMQALEDGRPLSVDYRIRDVDGRVRWVHDRAWLEHEHGLPVRAHGLLTDVTRRHRSDAVLEQLCEAERERTRWMREELRSRTTLMQLLVHDARTPLVGAREWLDIALGDGLAVDRDVQLEMLGRAREDLGRLGRLLEAVGERHALLARAGGGEVQRLHVADVARRVVGLLDQGDHEIEVEGDADVHVDGFLVERILANLVDNACRHSPPGTRVHVRLGPTDDDAGWWATVDDDGDGVPEADRERVFEPLFRGDDGGTGMGLAIVRDLVAALGGQVWVEEAFGGGASFCLVLPDASGRPGAGQ